MTVLNVCLGWTVQEVWSCWMELLQYLDMEQSWLSTVEQKVQSTDKLPESTEAVAEALEVRTHTHTHFILLFSPSVSFISLLLFKEKQT